ncbi:MAG: ABC transporter ATP-binding protein [Candidatus Rokubacteria bacterium]|nr:ABC transporter ATP-binding protein [Candidatus Rokubacteria bacterium]
MASLLRGRGITKSFGGLLALDRVDLEVGAGEVVGLIGQNGAGKTTLINAITGVHRPDAGSITFDGQELTRLAPDRIARLGIARTFQIPQPFPTLTILENAMVALVFGPRASGLAEAEARARTILESVGLGGKADLPPDHLNIVELRKLELARALASGARLLLLDEINAGLTAAEIQEAIALIEGLRRQGLAILMVEHVMRVILRVCERIIVLHFGRKIAEGTPREIAGDPAVITAYLGARRAAGGGDRAGR